MPGLNDAVRVPGLTNSWTQPIRTRIDMLSTGIRTPIGVKVMGDDLQTLGDVAGQIADGLKSDPRTAGVTTSAFAEKTTGGRYLDIDIDRDAIARFGLSVSDVQDTIMTALGGMNVTTTVEGLERYPVNLRYPSELRDDLPAIRRTLVATPTGTQVPLGQLADLSFEPGPPMVKSENARLTAWVYVDIANVDIGSYVENAKAVVAETRRPAGRVQHRVERAVPVHAGGAGQAAHRRPPRGRGDPACCSTSPRAPGCASRSFCWPCPSRWWGRCGSSTCSTTT